MGPRDAARDPADDHRPPRTDAAESTLAVHADTTPPPDARATGDVESDDAPAVLVAYALVLVVLALGAIGLVAQAYPVLPTISISPDSPDSEIAIGAGIVFWVAIGFAGSIRPQSLAGGAVVTLHMPFVIAGTILGGPMVGAIMGVISLTELREIRRVPWYGVLANHAICVLAAVAAGIAGQAAIDAVGNPLDPQNATMTLAIGLVVAGTFLAMNLLLVLPVVALRTGAAFESVVRRSIAALRVTLIAEVTLGWLMAVTFLWVAWWAPVVCVFVILVVWDAHDRREALRHDPMTGLLNDAGFEPLLEDALDGARRHGRRHALLFIDLDRFGGLNKQHGGDVGDDVIRAVAHRMSAAVRGTDVVGRQNRAGDEFLILLCDLPDDEAALTLAWRIHATIGRPVRVRGDQLTVSVGASIGLVVLVPGTTESLGVLKRRADRRMQRVKRAGGGVLGPSDDDENAPPPR